jgi:tRNA G18 (ribose-2'-O)-methylase SpoU
VQKNVQLSHSDHQAVNSRFPLTIVANDFCSPLNVGSLFRLCDALGINKLYLCGDTPAPPNAKIKKTSRSTENQVDYEYSPDAEAMVAELKAAGSLIISLEITTASISINSAEFNNALKNTQSVCLILGSENTGVSESLLSLSDITVHIPMYGNNSSMNVISAASIACFEIVKLLLTTDERR